MSDLTDATQLPDRPTQDDRVAGPTEEHESASRASKSRFEQLLRENAELLHLEREAQRILGSPAPSTFETFSQILDALLPRDTSRLRDIAQALEVEPSVLERVRSSKLDPLEVPPQPLTILARMLHLEYATFWRLALRDHERVAGTAFEGQSGGLRQTKDIETALRRAWERDTLDDASRA